MCLFKVFFNRRFFVRFHWFSNRRRFKLNGSARLNQQAFLLQYIRKIDGSIAHFFYIKNVFLLPSFNIVIIVTTIFFCPHGNVFNAIWYKNRRRNLPRYQTFVDLLKRFFPFYHLTFYFVVLLLLLWVAFQAIFDMETTRIISFSPGDYKWLINFHIGYTVKWYNDAYVCARDREGEFFLHKIDVLKFFCLMMKEDD